MTAINTNLASLYAQKNLGRVGTAMPTAVERLSTGIRINRAKDDAAGLGISEKIASQVKATTQSVKNANDAISMVQAAEGSLAEVSTMLQRMKELTIQGRNGSYNTSQRKTLTDEIFALRDEINLVAERTTFNGLSLLKTALKGSSAIAVNAASGGAQQAGWEADDNIMAGLNLTDIVLDNANVGQYKVSVTATSMTLTAVASTTGLSGVAIGNSIGLSQSIMFEDVAREVYANTDDYADNGQNFFKLASSTAINLNFDRLGIKFELTNQDAAADANVTAFATTLNNATLTVSTGTMQAVFQAGANTRDTFVVNGFQDVRIFDRNLNYDGGDQDTYMVFSRLNDTLKSMSDQTEAVLSSDNFTDLSNRLEDVIVAVTEIRSGLARKITVSSTP